MSTRAIAPIVGKNQSTIRDDLQVSGNYSPKPERETDSMQTGAGLSFGAVSSVM
ncbi:hypothetical protein [Glutamicibacter ardleyensis]|uniref:Uncharacterized protein n=1 Tax=Glutamicibacter ardleyensis TaxID=225894 RepID=A0ABQ2DUF2_9MICC|nr:hypothetical protein [Glutamicibacter ardleyensis]GGJ72852.1 hypothetical protein GCM10007173_34830 [Glutamicibacter ardleyensis]